MSTLPTTDHANRAHALLSASGSHKWLHCPPSARLEETLPESTSSYAEEGRLAHELAELRLRKHYWPMKPSLYNKALKKLQDNPLWQDEMMGCVDAYMDYIAKAVHSYSSPPSIALERRVDYSPWVTDGFGSVDCRIIGGDTLYITDYKHGKGVVVEAIENPQLKLYALGELRESGLLYDIKRVVLAIIQPRAGGVSEWEITADELRAWGESIKPIAQLAFAGQGDFCAGEWCRWCRAKAQCRARKEQLLQLEGFRAIPPALLSAAEIADAITRGQTIAKWVADVEEYALAATLRGEEIPGYKAVAGRSSRQFTDTDAAMAALKAAGFEEAVLYERRPLTLAALEKVVGKKPFGELMAPHIITPMGKPTLVPASDTRPPYQRPTAAEEFQPVSDQP